MRVSLEDHPYLVPANGDFTVARAATAPPADAADRGDLRDELKALRRRLDEQQRMLYARRHFSVLLVFQAMDAAGKDSTLRSVFRRIDPNGCRVSAFKAPSQEELAHDFLWRTAQRLPEKGIIGIFNRSYYEEVLVVRVHPEYLAAQRLPETEDLDELWDQRFRSIRDHERHLAEAGTLVIKFWLNVSRDEQARRFIARIDDPEKRFKFSFGDVRERSLWPQYMHAYEEALRATSRPWAPWYAIPADDKDYMRCTVAQIVSASLDRLQLAYPQPEAEQEEELAAMRSQLESEIGRG
ncbi:MAG: PPK2 family polyphosphate kinase [Pseudomonadota bacterium]